MSIISEAGRWPIYSKVVVPVPCSIEIKLDHHFASKVYTSGSVIAGEAIIRPKCDVAYVSFDISFTGVATVFLDSLDHRKESSWQFMSLRMPIPNGYLPDTKTFEAGRTYTVPFNFVVPHQLNIGACNHRCGNIHVLEHHLRLPPTMGLWNGNDQSCPLTRIDYSIKTKVTLSYQESSGTAPTRETVFMIKVLPALPEDAPLDINIEDDGYTLRKRSKIRGSMLQRKRGVFTASAHQPNAVMLSADGHGASVSLIRISLKFVASSAEAPPRINSVWCKIISTTTHSTSTLNHMPTLLTTWASHNTEPNPTYRTTNTLFRLPAVKIAWTQEKLLVEQQPESVSDGADGASETNYSKRQSQTNSKTKNNNSSLPTTYTASLKIPFTIPNGRKHCFLPTFQSCLISRVYTLQISLYVGPTNTRVSLAIPLQIGVETIYEAFDDELWCPESTLDEDDLDVADAQPSQRTQMMRWIAQSNITPPAYKPSTQVLVSRTA